MDLNPQGSIMNRLACYAKKLELFPETDGNQAREGIIRGALYEALSGSSL